MKPNDHSERAAAVLLILLLAAFLICGLRHFRDYGATVDEINQIDAGHITWKAVRAAFGKSTPEFEDLPELKNYYNRYYGQAATFPTVVIEAFRNFTMDKSSIIRLRHLWNFLLYFTGTACLAVLTLLRFRRKDITFFLVLLYILTPRLFGDSFYNDRDVLLISLIWMSLLCFEIYRRRPGILTALVCSFFFALAVNTRLFALILLPLPFLHLCFGKGTEKKNIWIIPLMTLVFFYVMTPLFWGNFIKEFISGFTIFSSGRQRTQETGGMASVLFFGNYYRENDLPFWYLPVWIFISTPLIPQLLCAAGLMTCLRKQKDRIMDLYMTVLLLAGIAAVMLIRPVLYTGWRHMYFFYVPIFYFMGDGLSFLLSLPRNRSRLAGIALILASVLYTGFRIASLHPYEYIYLNPLFRSREADFDHDYWRISTTECMEWIGDREPEEISIGEYNESLDNTVIGLAPQLRHRLYIQNYLALHRTQPDYLIFNYSGYRGAEKTIPLYETVHSVKRDDVRLAEIYHRISPAKVRPEKVTPFEAAVTDGSPETQWRSEKPQAPGESFIFEFAEPTALIGLSVLPGDDEREYARDPQIFISENGENWESVPVTVSGLFDISFPEIRTSMLKLQNNAETDVFWSIREILFYSPAASPEKKP